MIKSLIGILCSGLLLISCTSSKQKEKEEPTIIIPYINYVQEQLTLLDSTPTTVSKINSTTVQNKTTNTTQTKTDTSIITKAELVAIIKQLNVPDIAKAGVQEHYTKSSYNDLGSQRSNFNYTTNDNTMPLKSLTLCYSNETVASIKAILYTRVLTQNEITTQVNVAWEANKFIIINSVQDSSNISTQSSTQVVWGR